MPATVALLAAVLGAMALPSPTRAQTPTTGATPSPASNARAVLIDPSGAAVGQVRFTRLGGDVTRVTAEVSGLAPGFHGFHVHDVGSCVPPSFTSAGGHYNPGGTNHSEHAGDLPVLLVRGDGSATATFTTDRFTVAELVAADTAVVVHANPDNYANIPATDVRNPDGTFAQRAYYYKPDPAAENFVPGPAPDTTLRTGDAGGRVACGVVEATTTPFPEPTPPIPAAEAVLRNSDGAEVGRVTMAEVGPTQVQVTASGLPPGFHGFHVHDVGSCVPPSFTSAGGHYNPGGTNHREHAGDLPVLLVREDGGASATFTTDRFTVSELLAADVSIVVHANPDNYANIPATDVRNPDGTFAQRAYYYKPDPAVENFVAGPAPDTTLRTGDAGARLACGVLTAFGASPTPTVTGSPTRSPTSPFPTVTDGNFERTIRLEASKNRKTFGRVFTLTATITAESGAPASCTEGVRVTIERTIVGRQGAQEVATATTDESGVASFSRRADRSANYVATIQHDLPCGAASSNPEPVLVRKLVLLLFRPKGSVSPGTSVDMRVSVIPCEGHRGDRVTLWKARRGVMTKVATEATNRNCVGTFTRTVRGDGVWQGRAPKSDPDHLGGRSRKKLVEVR